MLQPKQQCEFLGFVFDTIDMSISLPENKRKKILQLTRKFLKLPSTTIREFSQFIGTLTAACPAVKYGWVYTKILEREKFLALHNYPNYDTKFKPSSHIIPDLHWWEANIMHTKNSVTAANYDTTIFTDASMTGWGAVCNDMRANGHWNDSEMKFHINYLELQAAFLGLKCFAEDKQNCAILMRIDNTTAISYINRMGGIQFSHLNKLARTIWQWCEERNLWLFASYINSKDNVEADEESRRINPDTELELSSYAFKRVVEQFGQPHLDLFASRANTKCEIYVSWRPDPNALTFDAFTLSWHNYYFYCFPPFPLILKCLQKIVNEHSTGIFVFPYWPTQAWFPLLNSLRITEILFLNNALRSHYSVNLHQKITLGAVIVSGRRSHDVESPVKH